MRTTTYSLHIALFLFNALLLFSVLVGLAAEVSHLAGHPVQVPVAGGEVAHGFLALLCLVVAALLLVGTFRIALARLLHWHCVCTCGVPLRPVSASGRLLVATMVATAGACVVYWLAAPVGVVVVVAAVAVIAAAALVGRALRETSKRRKS